MSTPSLDQIIDPTGVTSYEDCSSSIDVTDIIEYDGCGDTTSPPPPPDNTPFSIEIIIL